MQTAEKKPYEAPSARIVEVYGGYPSGYIQEKEDSPGEHLFLADQDTAVYPIYVKSFPAGRRVAFTGALPAGTYRIFGGDAHYFRTPSTGRISMLCPRTQVQGKECHRPDDLPGLVRTGDSPVTVHEKGIFPKTVVLIPAQALLEIPVRNTADRPVTLCRVSMAQMTGREIPSVLGLEQDGTVSVGLEAALAECFSVCVSLATPVVIAPGNSYIVRMLVAPFEIGPSRFTVNTAEKGDLIFFKERGMAFLSGHSHRVTGIEIRE